LTSNRRGKARLARRELRGGLVVDILGFLAGSHPFTDDLDNTVTRRVAVDHLDVMHHRRVRRPGPLHRCVPAETGALEQAAAERRLDLALLVDCTDDVVHSLRSANYDLAVGYTGYFVEHPTMDIPAALHERDLLVIDLDPGWTPRDAKELYPAGDNLARGNHAREPRDMGAPLDRFGEAMSRGGIVIYLMEGVTPPLVGAPPLRGESFDWLPGARQSLGGQHDPLTTTAIADDRYLSVPGALFDELPELAHLLSSQVQEVRGLRTLSGVGAILLNESGRTKAGVFQSILHGKKSGPVMLLPYFRRKPAALHALLTGVLPKLSPALFPERDRSWATDGDDYQMPAVLDARRKRQELVRAHEQAMAELDAEEAAAVLAARPFTALLNSHGEDLHPVVRDALDWLGFQVRDYDAERKAAGERLVEDLQVKDGEYFAVVEVTSSKGNAKDKDFQDLTKYILWRTRDPGRDDVKDVQGLLVMNQHYLVNDRENSPVAIVGFPHRLWGG
jgi:hypothetical protein